MGCNALNILLHEHNKQWELLPTVTEALKLLSEISCQAIMVS